MPQAGLLVQLDTSEHLWLPSLERNIYLILLIDDATNRIEAGKFVFSDSTVENMQVLGEFFRQKGLPNYIAVTHFIKCSNPAVRAEVIEPQVFKILEEIISHPVIKSGRYDNLIKTHKLCYDEYLNEKSRELREKLRQNLEKQTKLNEAYLDNLVAIDVFRDKSVLLREEEKQLKNEIAKFEMKLIEKEKSEEYQRLLKRVIDNFEETKKNIDIIAKKELLRLISKRVMVEMAR